MSDPFSFDDSPAGGHRWSGWPGAWCLDCGIEDPLETCAAGDECDWLERSLEADAAGEPGPPPCPVHPVSPCLEPGSGRCDPYDPRNKRSL